MFFYHVVITVCACTFVTCTLIKTNQSIKMSFDSRFGWSKICIAYWSFFKRLEILNNLIKSVFLM